MHHHSECQSSQAGQPDWPWADAAERRWRTDAPPAPPIIEPGLASDLAALLPLHYRGGTPATRELILRAVDAVSGEVAGVLVVSRPTLNGPPGARDNAWPRVFQPRMSRQDRARAVNQALRTISRVIVDPRFRACGVASALVAAYLRAPLTPLTEAIASMGRLSPVFVASGMRQVHAPAPRRDDIFARALRRHRLHPTWFMDPRRAAAMLRRHEVRDAVLAWRRDGRTSLPQGAPIEHVAALAAARVAAPPRIYVYP